MKERLRLTSEEHAAVFERLNRRERLPVGFNVDEHLARIAAHRERFRIGNIPDTHECKYIYGEVGDPEAHYCGKATVPSYSWCPQHKKLCLRKISDYEEVVYRRKRGKWY